MQESQASKSFKRLINLKNKLYSNDCFNQVPKIFKSDFIWEFRFEGIPKPNKQYMYILVQYTSTVQYSNLSVKLNACKTWTLDNLNNL